MRRFTIPGRLPGNNEFIAANRSSRYKGNDMKQEAQDTVAWCIRAARLTRVEGAVIINYRFYEPNMRRDADNIFSFAAKVVQDALVAERVIKDDSQKYVVGFSARFAVDKDNPRIEVELEEVK